MNSEELIAEAPALLRLAGVQPAPDDLERLDALLSRRRAQPLPSRTTEPLLNYDVHFWNVPRDVADG